MRELWADLSNSMRLLRTNAGRSLRQVETATGKGRGTLSQIENAKARPPAELVEWYDREFGGDGLLMSVFAEARGTHQLHLSPRRSVVQATPGDDVEVCDPVLPSGCAAQPGAVDLVAGWTLRNTGTVSWSGRGLRRVGAPAAVDLIRSPARVAVAACDPGESVAVRIPIALPDSANTFAAYWQFVDAEDRSPFEPAVLLSVTVVAIKQGPADYN